MSFLLFGNGGGGGGGDPHLRLVVDSYNYLGDGRIKRQEQVPPPGDGVTAPPQQ